MEWLKIGTLLDGFESGGRIFDGVVTLGILWTLNCGDAKARVLLSLMAKVCSKSDVFASLYLLCSFRPSLDEEFKF